MLSQLCLWKSIWKSWYEWMSRNPPSRERFFSLVRCQIDLSHVQGMMKYFSCQWQFSLVFVSHVPSMAPRSCNAHISFNLTLILPPTTQLPALGAIIQKCNTFFFCCHFYLKIFILSNSELGNKRGHHFEEELNTVLFVCYSFWPQRPHSSTSTSR